MKKKLTKGQKLDLKEFLKKNAKYGQAQLSNKELAQLAGNNIGTEISKEAIQYWRDKLGIQGKAKKEAAVAGGGLGGLGGSAKTWKGGSSGEDILKALLKQSKKQSKLLTIIVDRFTKKSKVVTTTVEAPK